MHCLPPTSVQAADTLRTALAMGADRAVHVQTADGESPEPLAVAKLLAAVGVLLLRAWA